MDLYNIFNDLEKVADSNKAILMSKYLRNKFNFLGVTTPLRKQISKDYFKYAKKSEKIDWDFVSYCWKKEYREGQHVAIDYLKVMKTHLKANDIDKIKELVVSKSWWDSVDGLLRIVGDLALKYPQLNNTMLLYSLDDNIWLRRIAITHQLLRKDKTNVKLLEKILVNNLYSNEFFINKAIGWMLRDYSKTNPIWVRSFIENNKEGLSKLSIKEASKYL